MIRIINEHDRWGLISLRNADGRNLELVNKIKEIKLETLNSLFFFRNLLNI